MQASRGILFVGLVLLPGCALVPPPESMPTPTANAQCEERYERVKNLVSSLQVTAQQYVNQGEMAVTKSGRDSVYTRNNYTFDSNAYAACSNIISEITEDVYTDKLQNVFEAGPGLDGLKTLIEMVKDIDPGIKYNPMNEYFMVLDVGPNKETWIMKLDMGVYMYDSTDKPNSMILYTLIAGPLVNNCGLFDNNTQDIVNMVSQSMLPAVLAGNYNNKITYEEYVEMMTQNNLLVLQESVFTRLTQGCADPIILTENNGPTSYYPKNRVSTNFVTAAARLNPFNHPYWEQVGRIHDYGASSASIWSPQ